MKLHSLELQNFRQHRTSSFEFPEGLLAIVGANGAGKTTVVEAIAFALYGARAIRGRVDQVRTRGAKRGEATRVVLCVELAATIYRIERDLNNASLQQGGVQEPLATGTTEVSERVADLIGMSLEEFRATYFTEQKSLEFLSGSKGAAERERFITRLVGLERIERMQGLLRVDRNELKREIAAWQTASGGRTELEQRIAADKVACEQAEVDYKSKCAGYESAEKKLREVEEQNVRDKGRRERYRELRGELEHLERKRIELQSRAEPLDRLREERLQLLAKLVDESMCPTCGQSISEEQERTALERRERVESERLECDLAQIRDEEREVLAEIERLTDKLAQPSINESEVQVQEQVYQSARRLYEVARLARVKSEGELTTRRELYKRSQEELATFDARAGRDRDNRRRLGYLEESDSTLTRFRTHLNESIRPRLAELASEFLVDLTDGRYATVVLGADYVPTVLEDGSEKQILSGGEQDVLNLCVRLALSHLLAERAGSALSFIVLDEVFGALDQVRRNNVLQLLDKLRMRFDQILIITHLDDVKDAVEHIISIEYDDARQELQVGGVLSGMIYGVKGQHNSIGWNF
mgnify:CR=1 FL=1